MITSSQSLGVQQGLSRFVSISHVGDVFSSSKERRTNAWWEEKEENKEEDEEEERRLGFVLLK